MCGNLHLENQSKLTPIGSSIPTSHINGATSNYNWTGFARSDGSRDNLKTMAQQWRPEQWKVSLIKASGFTEKDKGKVVHQFGVKSGHIGCLTNPATRELKIITRPARTEYEKSIHFRAPSQIPSSMSIEDYTKVLNKLTDGQYSPL